MPRPRRERSKLKREEDRAVIASMRREGALQGEIAHLLGISRQTVGKEEAELIAAHRARAAKDTQTLICESLARTEWGQRQAAALHLTCMAAMFGSAEQRARQAAMLAGADWEKLSPETQAALAVAVGDQNDIRGVGLALFHRFEVLRIELLGLAGQHQPEVGAEGVNPKDVVTAEDAERAYRKAVGTITPFRLPKGRRRA